MKTLRHAEVSDRHALEFKPSLKHSQFYVSITRSDSEESEVTKLRIFANGNAMLATVLLFDPDLETNRWKSERFIRIERFESFIEAKKLAKQMLQEIDASELTLHEGRSSTLEMYWPD